MLGTATLQIPIAVKATLASVALLASTTFIPVFAGEQGSASGRSGTVETAFATARLSGPATQSSWRDSEVGMIRPLSAADAARIRTIFSLQQAGRLAEAARLIHDLHDTTLLGEILADHYLAPGWIPDQASLRQWMQTYSDLPDAPAIRHLLSDLSRGRTTLATVSSSRMLDADQPASSPPEEADPAEQAFQRNARLDRTIAGRLAQGAAGPRSALRLLDATRHIDPLYAAMLRAEIAHDLFTHGDDALAISTARTALQQSGGSIGLAGYVAGLAAWRQGQFELAQTFFEQASRAPLAAASTRAGAAFWAARTHLRLQDPAGSHRWLQHAAASSHTFYGILAAAVLGQDAEPAAGLVVEAADITPVNAGSFVLGEIDVEAVAATPEGQRAFALLQVGQSRRAEAALRQLWPRVQKDAALCRSIALVAQAAGMTDLSVQLATILQSRDGQPRDLARFPVPNLRPRQGFIVNPALVYALTRLESNFNNKAVSGAGAHGLMQIMPVTANFVLEKNGAHPHRFRDNVRALHDPAVNLEIGQLYLSYLATQNGINGDLISLLASYNAGPNALAQWQVTRPRTDDPLLFIESLPVRETRDFVHRALSYLWIYDVRMGLPTPSLDTLAQGHWPRFDDEQKIAGVKVGASQAGSLHTSY